MSWLSRVIARVLGLTTKPTVATPVLQTQIVGPVRLMRTTKAGKKPTAQGTKSQSVRKSVKSDNSLVPQTTQAPSRKQGSKPAQITSGNRGRPRKTVA